MIKDDRSQKGASLRARWGAVRFLERSGRLKEAESELSKILAVWPKNIKIEAHLAQISQKRGNLQQALQYWQSILKKAPENRQARQGEAVLLERLDRLDEAKDAFKKIAALDFKDPRPHLYLARIAQKQGHDTEAMQQWKTVAKNFPDDLKVAVSFALYLEKQGELKQAEQSFDRIIHRWPEDTQARYGKARIYELYAPPEEALKQWQAIVTDFPGDAQARIALASYFERRGQLIKALRELDFVITRWPGEIQAWLGQARIAMLQSQPEEALLKWRAMGERFPQNIMIMLGLAKCLEAQKRFSEAKEVFDQAIQQWPGDVRPWCGKARVEEKLNLNLTQTLQLWKKIIAQFPQSPLAARSMAKFLRRQGEVDHALTLTKQALAQWPNQIETRILYFNLLVQKEAYHQALDRIKTWFDETPAHPDIFRCYVTILKILGRDHQVRDVHLRHGQGNIDLIGDKTLFDALFKQEDHELPINESLVQNMWTAWGYADQSVWQWHEWRRAAIWGIYANWTLKVCMNNRPDLLPQVDEMIVPPCLNELKAALSQGNGCLLVSTHNNGPSTVSMRFFDQSPYPLYTLASTGEDLFNESDPNAIFMFSKNHVQSLRTLIRKLKSGAIGALVADQSTIQSDTVTLPFLKGSVHLSSLAPRLAYKFSIPTFWCQAIWKDQKIVTKLSPLPIPVSKESETAFITRWFASFLDHLKQQYCGRPENYSFGSSWRTL
ncbi:tetratricopeptide repeat protein [Magnetococcales bacterium HHB-1]